MPGQRQPRQKMRIGAEGVGLIVEKAVMLDAARNQQVFEAGDIATDFVELFRGHRASGQGAELDCKIAAVGQGRRVEQRSWRCP